MAVKTSLPISSIAVCPLGLLAFAQFSQSIAKAPEAKSSGDQSGDQAIAKIPQFIPKALAIVTSPQSITKPQFAPALLLPTPLKVPAAPLLKPVAPPTLPNLNALPWERIVARSLGNPLGVIKSSVSQVAAAPTPPIVRPAPPPPPPAPVTAPIAAAPSFQRTAPAPQPSPVATPAIAPIAAPAVAPMVAPTVATPMPTITPPEPSAIVATDTFAPAPQSLPLPNPSINVAPPAPLSSPAPAESAYVLGAGDRVTVNVLNVPEYSGEYQVMVDGTILLPVAGTVTLKGLTLQQASDAIAAQYGSELSRFSQVTVNLSNSRPLQVAIVGEVGLPGLYTLKNEGGQLPSIAQALQTAGGLTQSADLRQVQIRRSAGSQPQTLQVDLWRLLQGGDQSQNITLRDGDSIIIPANASLNLSESSQLADSNLGETTAQNVKVALIGEVVRPGAYQIESSNTKRLTLTSAIQTAGGITPSADIRQVQIRRFTRDGQEQMLTVNLWELMQSGDLSQDIPLQNGDTITFAKAAQMTAAEAAQMASTNLSANEVQISLIGELKSPGTLTLPSNTSLNQALLRAGGLNSRARKSRVQLIRMETNGSLTRRTIEIDRDADANTETNPILWNNDIIVVSPSSGARLTDSITDILSPIMRILPPLRLLL